MGTRPLLIIASLAAAFPASADTLVYSTDFENGAGTEWSDQTTTSAATFTRFLGRYSGTSGVELDLGWPSIVGGSAPGAHTGGADPGDPGDTGGSGSGGGSGGGSALSYLLVFDFYCIDSWDGVSIDGPDKFKVTINDVTRLDSHFSNHLIYHEYASLPTIGPDFLGFSQYQDSIYRDVSIPFDPGATPTLNVRFEGQVWQGLADESWGIDNVRIYAVPTPGSVALLAMGGLVLARRRR